MKESEQKKDEWAWEAFYYWDFINGE